MDTATARDWFGAEFLAVYLQFKKGEVGAIAHLGADAFAARHAEVY